MNYNFHRFVVFYNWLSWFSIPKLLHTKIWNDRKINRQMSFDIKFICWKKELGKKLFFLSFFTKVKSFKRSLEKKPASQPQSEWFSIPIFFPYSAETIFHMSLRPLCKFRLNRKKDKTGRMTGDRGQMLRST